jgi:predicted DNA-binding ribbon-helix-helix protein
MYQNPEEATFQKRSVTLLGHKTSVALEKLFWTVLEEAAVAQGISLTQLIKDIDGGRKSSLSSALRLYALRYVQGKIS